MMDEGSLLEARKGAIREGEYVLFMITTTKVKAILKFVTTT
jgi:hypothetical protein